VTVITSEVPEYSQLYRDVFRFCLEHDMSLDENYQYICSKLDVESLIDWIIMEGFCSNADLTYGNLRYCMSTENDGKWRLMFYDLDSTFYKPDKTFHNLLSGTGLQKRQVSRLIATLLRNEDFVDSFLSRAAAAFDSSLTNENVIAEIDRLAAILEPEVARDYANHGMTLEKWLSNIEYLKEFIIKKDWQQTAIDNLCRILFLTAEERAAYFGQ